MVLDLTLARDASQLVDAARAQLWLYRAWSEWMGAENWADLKANHSRPEGTVSR